MDDDIEFGTEEEIEAIEAISGAFRPLPLTSTKPPRLEYPVDCLSSLGEVAKIFAEAAQVPIDLACQNVLAVASFIAQKHSNIRTLTGAIRPLSLSLISIIGVASRKKFLDDVMFSVIREMENENRERLMAQVERMNDDEQDILSKRELEALPLKCLMIMSDLTLQHILVNADYIPASIIYKANNLSYIIPRNNANDAKKPIELDCFEKLWDGDSFIYQRSGTTKFINSKGMTFNICCLDDEILSSDKKVNRYVSSLIERSLIVWPPSIVGRRKISTAILNDVPTINKFRSNIRDLLEGNISIYANKMEKREKKLMRFHPGAQVILEDFLNNIEKHSHVDGWFGSIVGFSDRSEEHLSRIAGTLAFYEDPFCDVVSVDIAKKAAKLLGFYFSEAKIVSETYKTENKLKDAEDLLEWLRKKAPKLSTTNGHYQIAFRYMQQNTISRLRTKDRLDEALKVLEQHRWIRRSGSFVYVNPAIEEQKRI